MKSNSPLPTDISTSWRPFLREFMQWKTRNETQLKVRLDLVRQSRHWLEFQLPDFPKEISIYIFQRDDFREIGGKKSRNSSECVIGISITVNGENFDHLQFFETIVHRIHGGFTDPYQIDDYAGRVFPTQQSIWQELCFDPLLDWLNNTLGNAIALRLAWIGGGSTSADLIHHQDQLRFPSPGVMLSNRLVPLPGPENLTSPLADQPPRYEVIPIGRSISS